MRFLYIEIKLKHLKEKIKQVILPDIADSGEGACVTEGEVTVEPLADRLFCISDSISFVVFTFLCPDIEVIFCFKSKKLSALKSVCMAPSFCVARSESIPLDPFFRPRFLGILAGSTCGVTVVVVIGVDRSIAGISAL